MSLKGLPLRLCEAGWYGAGFSVFLALGLINLFYPFGDDQAVLFYAAKELDRGAILYLDYWGNKQPGLYVFYLLAGRLFGFTELGIHLFELIWMGVLALVLMITLRPYLQARWLSALAPVATIGVYYATAREDELTQLEMLVALPLYLTAWCALRALQRSRNQPAAKPMALLFFASGLTAALATLFKLLLAPIPVAFWLIASVYLLRDGRADLSGLALRLWLPVALGVTFPFAGVTLWFWQAGALPELLWTAFIYPPEAYMSSPQAAPARLMIAAAFALSNLAPWLLFAGLAGVVWGRSGASPLVSMMLAWLALALVLLLIQRFSWWPYHTLLAFTPIGVLAVVGIDCVAAFLNLRIVGGARRLGQKAAQAMACTALFAIPLTASLTGPLVDKASVMFVENTRLVGDRLMAYQWRAAPKYKKIWQSSSFLNDAMARPGPVYAFGSAMVYAFTGRRSPHKTAGFSWEFYVPSQIRDILAALEAERVPYVFIEGDKFSLFDRHPEAAAFINSHYFQIAHDEAGVWYERIGQDPPPALPSGDGR